MISGELICSDLVNFKSKIRRRPLKDSLANMTIVRLWKFYILTLIWAGFLGVHFAEGVGGKTTPSKTCSN